MQLPWDENYKKGKAEHKVDTKEDIDKLNDLGISLKKFS
jgi:hypothetical protein